MTLWGFGAKSGSGWNEVDTSQTVMTTRAPAVLKKKSDDVVGRMCAQTIRGTHYAKIKYHGREVSS